MSNYNITIINTKEQFAAVVSESQEIIVIIICTANWCPPCQKVKSILFSDNTILNDFKAQNKPIYIYICDVDKDPDTAHQVNVRTIPFPCIAVKVNGKVIYTQHNLLTVTALQSRKDFVNCVHHVIHAINQEIFKQ